MKKYFLILIFAGLLISGCSSENNIVEPNNSIEQGKALVVETGFISLPLMKSSGSNQLLTDSQLIIGRKGGDLEVEGNVSGNVEAHSSLNIPEGAFYGSKTLSMSLDNGSTSVTFEPSPFIFSKSCILDLEYTGLSLTNKDKSLTFAYLLNGKYYPIRYDSIEVDIEEGKLIVRGAQIDHFSRFGFVR